MLVVFSPIFVEDTKIIYGYNFVAPLIFSVTRVISLFFLSSLLGLENYNFFSLDIFTKDEHVRKQTLFVANYSYITRKSP